MIVRFPGRHWSRVVALQDRSVPVARDALARTNGRQDTPSQNEALERWGPQTIDGGRTDSGSATPKLNVLGDPEYVTAQLTHRGEEQAVLFDRIPWVVEIQTGWLLLTFCAATRANDWLRTGPPELTAQYARLRDQRVLQGLSHVLRISWAP